MKRFLVIAAGLFAVLGAGAISPLTHSDMAHASVTSVSPRTLPQHQVATVTRAAPAYGSIYNQFICEDGDNLCAWSSWGSGKTYTVYSHAGNDFNAQNWWSLIYEGTVCGYGCSWPYKPGSGLNAKWNGYAVYNVELTNSGGQSCWVNGNNQSIVSGPYCSSSQWAYGNDWVAIPAADGSGGHFSLSNVINSNNYGTTMTASAWGNGQQYSNNYYGQNPYSESFYTQGVPNPVLHN